MSLGDKLRRDTRNDGTVSPGKLDRYYGPEDSDKKTGAASNGPGSRPNRQPSPRLASAKGIPAPPYTRQIQPPQQPYTQPPATLLQPPYPWQPPSQYNPYPSTQVDQASPPAISQAPYVSNIL